ncbi:hypothetical protein SAMD00019534_108820, partial [Acytostelium subglobosum LB1]|uniref:hypothetical protein n=1 Tax=Acytostelium subglobosum LB1 TaxID=1410327 RepID=UPI000644DB66
MDHIAIPKSNQHILVIPIDPRYKGIRAVTKDNHGRRWWGVIIVAASKSLNNDKLQEYLLENKI